MYDLLKKNVPYKQSSSVAVAGAIIGAVLALFIITIFIIVLLTPRKKRSSYLDKITCFLEISYLVFLKQMAIIALAVKVVLVDICYASLKEDQIQNLQDSINVKLYYYIRKEVIDLPPTHKPTSSYEKRNLSHSQKEIINALTFTKIQTGMKNSVQNILIKPSQIRNTQYLVQSTLLLCEIRQFSNGFSKMINCSRFSYEDENPASQDRDQQKYPAPKETNCKDWINKKHPNTGNGRIYINPREHYMKDEITNMYVKKIVLQENWKKQIKKDGVPMNKKLQQIAFKLNLSTNLSEYYNASKSSKQDGLKRISEVDERMKEEYKYMRKVAALCEWLVASGQKTRKSPKNPAHKYPEDFQKIKQNKAVIFVKLY
ncbi:Coagulation factor VIII, partial [Ophiophagus hannah]